MDNDSDRKEQYIKWLNDAYGMEQDISRTLDGQIDDLDDYPQLQEKIRDHKDITDQQAERLKRRIEELGAGTSRAKSFLAQIMGNIKGAMSEITPHDKAVKIAISLYATEQFEIASYDSLVAAANALGDEKTARMCQDIKREEEEMAKWAEKHIPQLTTQVLASLEV